MKKKKKKKVNSVISIEVTCPKVPFCTALGVLFFKMTHLYLYKNLLFKTRFSPVST